jgi:hypothetical protein
MIDQIAKSFKASLQQFFSLFYSPVSYKLLIQGSWKKILLMMLISHLTASVILSSIFYFRFLPATFKDFATVIEVLQTNLSQNLIFSWNADSLQLDVMATPDAQLPIKIPSNSLSKMQFMSSFDEYSLPQYFLSIEKDKLMQIQVVEVGADKNDSLLTLGSQGFWLNLASETESFFFEYSLFPQFKQSFEVSGEFVISYLNQTLQKTKNSFYAFWPLIFALAIPLTLLMTLLTLIIDLIFVIFLVKINQYDLKISQSIKLTLLVSGVSAIMNQLVNLLYPNISLPIYTITFWLIISYLLLINRHLWRGVNR